MFKKNPYIFFKELINNSYSEDLSESVARLALGWTQEKDYKLEYRLYYAVGSNVKFNTTYYRFNGNVHCYNELPLQLPERKLKLVTLASEKGFIKVKKKWFWKFFFSLTKFSEVWKITFRPPLCTLLAMKMKHTLSSFMEFLHSAFECYTVKDPTRDL